MNKRKPRKKNIFIFMNYFLYKKKTKNKYEHKKANTYFSHVNGTNICFLSSYSIPLQPSNNNKTLQKSLKLSVKATK